METLADCSLCFLSDLSDDFPDLSFSLPFSSVDLERRDLESLRLRFSSRLRDVERLERRDLDLDLVRCRRWRSLDLQAILNLFGNVMKQ